MLGDLYHLTEGQSTRTLHASDLALQKVKDACDEVGAAHDMIDGNHDLLSEQPIISAISNLKGYGNVIHEVTHIDQNGFNIAYLPGTDNIGLAFTRLSTAQQSADLICTHLDFQGCRYESGHPSESPLTPNWSKPIISGDIHLPQDVGSVHYVGALIQNKFYRTTLDQVGGVLLYDMETGKVTRVRNTYSKHYIKIIDGYDTDLPAPEHSVLQVVSTATRDEVAEKYKAYEHFHVPTMVTADETVKTNYSHFSLDNPEKLLRLHVNKERPEALDTYNEIMGKT
jgi:hypothetical protein